MTIQMILLGFAFVLACLAARKVGDERGWSLGWAAFACYVASVLFGPLHIGR